MRSETAEDGRRSRAGMVVPDRSRGAPDAGEDGTAKKVPLSV